MSDQRDNSKEKNKLEVEKHKKLQKQPTLLSFVTRNRKDEIVVSEAVSTTSDHNNESTGNILEKNSQALVSFDDFPNENIDSSERVNKSDSTLAITVSDSEPKSSKTVSTVTSSQDHNDIAPLYKELDFDFDAQIEKLKNYKFPHTGIGKDKRSFQLSWLNKFKWIEYFIRGNVAFCNLCRQFGTDTRDPTFTTTGFNKWKSALSNQKGFKRHETSEMHLSAAQRKFERQKREQTDTSVSTLVNTTVLLKRRYYLKSIIKTIIFLVEHHLALRGEWDDEKNEEDSLFNSLFEFALERDPELAICEKYMPANATYKSPAIQNEIINILARLLRKSIVREVMNADVNLFTILFDGTKDKHSDEIISLGARFVSGGKAKEALLFFETSEDQDAEAFTEVILQSMNTYELDALRILSQCYDGASVMNGYKSGVAKRLQDELKKIIPYVHCFNHRLHLVIIYLVKQIQAVREFFDYLRLIFTTLRKPKIKKIHEGKSMKRLIETRWSGHKNATKCMLEDYEAFVDTFRLAVKNTSKEIDVEDVAVCTGILAVITEKKFVFILIVMNELLSTLSPADTIFQKRDIGYKRAIPVIESVKSTILDYRTDENFKDFEKKAENLMNQTTSNANASSATAPRPVRQNRARSILLKDFIVEETLGERSEVSIELKSLYFEIIDVIVAELNSRFTENNQILLALSNAENMNIDDLKPLESLGIQLPSESELKVAKKYVDTKRLEHEKRNAERVEKGEDEKDLPRFNILETLYEVREIFPEVYSLFATVETFACSTSICECSFSSLSLVDTPKRFSMKNERLRNLAFLGFEKKRLKNIDIDDVLLEFNAAKQRKVQLF